MTSLHLRGTVLPEGDVRDIWVIGDRITLRRPAGDTATVHEGGFILPGLVDAHAHLGHHGDTMAFDPALFERAARGYASDGVTLLRIPGHRQPVPTAVREKEDIPRLVTAGPWLAWNGLEQLDGPQTVPDDLIAEARRQALA